MRFRFRLEVFLIVLGCVCLVAVGINVVAASSFQADAEQILERQMATSAPLDDPLVGRLEIPRLNMSVMVMQGDDGATLRRAVGLVPGTALPWEERGNAVLAGHRDTFFRPLKDVREGDVIRMTTARGTFDYRVTRTEIVEPDAVSVMAPTPTKALTLVTCYPFVYVGQAPLRFIVSARAIPLPTR